MNDVFNVLFYLGLSVLFIYAEPIILLKRIIGFKEENYFEYSELKKFIHKLIHCLFCSSLWISLIVSGSLYTAVIVSLFAYILENIIKK